MESNQIDKGTAKPQLVYKYHKINEHLITLISKGEFWFSPAANLNDVLDCRFSFSEKYISSILKSASIETLNDLKERSKHFDSIESSEFVEGNLSLFKKQGWMQDFSKMLFEQPGFGVCSFSTEPLDDLMWAHYGDAHKGVCLEFDLTKSPDLFEKLRPVQYVDIFEDIRSMDELPIAFLRKKTTWKYEKEWRIVSIPPSPKPFNKESLVAINFGYHVSKEIIDIFRDLLAKSGYTTVKFRKVRIPLIP